MRLPNFYTTSNKCCTELTCVHFCHSNPTSCTSCTPSQGKGTW